MNPDTWADECRHRRDHWRSKRPSSRYPDYCQRGYYLDDAGELFFTDFCGFGNRNGDFVDLYYPVPERKTNRYVPMERAALHQAIDDGKFRFLPDSAARVRRAPGTQLTFDLWRAEK